MMPAAKSSCSGTEYSMYWVNGTPAVASRKFCTTSGGPGMMRVSTVSLPNSPGGTSGRRNPRFTSHAASYRAQPISANEITQGKIQRQTERGPQ